MIVRLVRLTLAPDRLEAFDAMFWQHHADIPAQPGCHGVELLGDPEDAQVRLTLSRWSSEEALNQYRASALFGQIWPATKSMFAAKPRGVVVPHSRFGIDYLCQPIRHEIPDFTRNPEFLQLADWLHGGCRVFADVWALPVAVPRGLEHLGPGWLRWRRCLPWRLGC